MPEVVRWWDDPVEQLALLDEDLGDELMAMPILIRRTLVRLRTELRRRQLAHGSDGPAVLMVFDGG